MSDNSRRDFLFKGLLASASLVGCAEKKNPFDSEENVQLTGEKVKLLSVTGEVIEIDKAYLKPVQTCRLFPTKKSEEEFLAKSL